MDLRDILLVSDMDGTLLNPDHKIFDENVSAVSRFVADGGCFTLATGREWHALDEYAPLLPLHLPLILVNGAQIYDPVSDQVIMKQVLSGIAAELILDMAQQFPHLGMIAVSDGGALIMREPENRDTMPFFYQPYPVANTRELPDDVYKVLFVGALDDLSAPRELIDRHHQDSLSATCSYPTLLDIMSAGVSKGNALKMLPQLMDPICIQNKKIVVVGDQENDIEMFKVSDYAFAMGQASDHVKAAANEVLPPSGEPFMEVLLRRVSQL
ncbi:MAG: HAD family hydrolase [Clostridiaceae bacterium]|nr:HAD family hydrolase [Clostridiaceae bacterium]